MTDLYARAYAKGEAQPGHRFSGQACGAATGESIDKFHASNPGFFVVLSDKPIGDKAHKRVLRQRQPSASLVASNPSEETSDKG